MKRPLFMRAGILVAVAAAGFVALAWLTAPVNITTLERFAKISGGETNEELEELLGSPGVDTIGYPPVLIGKGPAVTSGCKEWLTRDGQHIVVCFDESGKVAASARFEGIESWLQKARRWLRLQ